MEWTKPDSVEYLAKAESVGQVLANEAEASSSDSESSNDDFEPVPSKKLVIPVTKQASMKWFRETQSKQIYDPVNADGNFIAEWFHGQISRRESERLLKDKPPGCFLIRVSESRFGYSLSFSGGHRTKHYMIDQLPNKKYIIIGEPKVHRTLRDLVKYHKTVKISNWDGFLTEPCGQEEGFCDYHELIGDNFFFQPEQNKQNGTSKMTYSSSNQPKNSHVTGVGTHPAADKNYSKSEEISNSPSSLVQDGRPLLTRLSDSHNRQLQKQINPSKITYPPRNSLVSRKGPPPVPSRNYSAPRGISQKSSFLIQAERPPPTRLNDAHKRLLQNQAQQHFH